MKIRVTCYEYHADGDTSSKLIPIGQFEMESDSFREPIIRHALDLFRAWDVETFMFIVEGPKIRQTFFYDK